MNTQEQKTSLPRINVYKCPLGHQSITNDVDTGVTPMFLTCLTEGCGQHATSSFYRVPPGLTPTHEWYKPNIADCKEHELDHVLNGGLLLRKIDTENNNYAENKPASATELKAIHDWLKSFKKAHPAATEREIKRKMVKKFNIGNLIA